VIISDAVDKTTKAVTADLYPQIESWKYKAVEWEKVAVEKDKTIKTLMAVIAIEAVVCVGVGIFLGWSVK